jgi:hypothetical protein
MQGASGVTTISRGDSVYDRKAAKNTHKSLMLWFEAALRYSPVVDIAIAAFRKPFQTLPGVVKQLVFVTEHVTPSATFERVIVEEVLTYALAVEFRSNPLLMKKFARMIRKCCTDNKTIQFSRSK